MKKRNFVVVKTEVYQVEIGAESIKEAQELYDQGDVSLYNAKLVNASVMVSGMIRRSSLDFVRDSASLLKD